MRGFLLGLLLFVGVMLAGAALGIHPTLAEAVLVCIACAVSEVLR